VTVVALVVIAGGEMRPVAGRPLEQACSQTRMCSDVAAGPGAGNEGSSAQVAGPNSEGTRSVAEGRTSAWTGQVGSDVEAPEPKSHALTRIDSATMAIAASRTVRAWCIRLARSAAAVHVDAKVGGGIT
jgi:hypothetical protein